MQNNLAREIIEKNKLFFKENNKKSLIFDIIPGYGCNFRCSYCFNKRNDNKAYKNISMSEKTVERTIEYMNYVTRKYSDEYTFHNSIYGGEPMLYTDIVKKFLTTKQRTGIITNGTLLNKKLDWIKSIEEMTNNRVSFGVSYDYSLQNSHRQDGTYDIVRNNIRLLHNNNISFSTITVFPKGDLPKIYDVYMDMLKLRREIPSLYLCFNVDRVNVSNTTFDEKETRKALEKIRNYNERNNIRGAIKYNINYSAKRTTKDYNCLWGNVYCAFDVNGDIFPCCNSIWEPNNILDIIKLGNVYEDFSILDEKREELISKLDEYPYPKKCYACNVPCRVMPWRTIKNDISEYNGMPSDDHCKIHKLLFEYL